MTRAQLIGEGLSIIAGICLWISVIAKSQRGMMMWQTIECVFRVIGVLLLGGLSGSMMLLMCIFRNLAINGLRGLNKEKAARIAVILAEMVYVAIGFATFNHWYDLFSIGTCLIFNACLLTEDIIVTKWNVLQNMTCWMLYSICIGGVVMTITYAIMTVTAIISLRMTVRKVREKKLAVS